MEQIIERLRAEKAESGTENIAWGKEEGLKWVKDAHYDEIQFVLRWDVNHPIPDDGTIASENLITYFKELFVESATLLGLNDDESGCWVEDGTLLFLKGWKEVVEEFWEQVKDKL